MKRKTVQKNKPIRVGVVGVGRGESFAANASDVTGLKLVAVCDTWKDRLETVGKRYGVTTYSDYDKFLEHDMDAVVLANYFHQHAPFAIKALQAGFHVMSETACNTTLAEGVALCREVERSKRIYMLAENYPYNAFALEMQRLYKAGEIGEVIYADGEYNHPMSPDYFNSIAAGEKHWRNYAPSTYYCTHALAPLVHITDTLPVQVNALSMSFPEMNDRYARRADVGSVILCRMNNGAVFRLMGLFMPGESIWYRLHGTGGAMENERGGASSFGSGRVRVWHEEWLANRQLRERIYLPDWPEHAELANAAGHCGGDFWTNFHFANAIRTGRQPFLDVYRGVTMSSIGVLAWRSALNNGSIVDVPDFRKESIRRKYENDHDSPWADGTGNGELPWSVRGFAPPSRKGLEIARKRWKQIGYTGK